MSKQNTPDKRKVFVVFGRNTQARDALFTFLRAIDLSPIEWEEAIQTVGSGAPYIGDVLDSAFGRAQAVVVLLTGDDMARVGKRYQDPHDPHDEKNLTPQARPNVLFEAGMALGRYPDRTVLVSIGTFRQFSDIIGRHIVRLSNKTHSRQALADRLKTAGCAVRTNYRMDWHNAGDFDASLKEPDDQGEYSDIRLRVMRRFAQFDSLANNKRKVWIYIRNDGEECLELTEPSWRPSEHGVGGTMISPTFQLKVGTDWVPIPDGLDRLHLHPGAYCSMWIAPIEKLDFEQVKEICQSDKGLGSIHLLANGKKTTLSV